MFMQIIQGRVRDPDEARATLDNWLTELTPSAIGWLGGTYGITDDCTLLACLRFEDAAAARENARRPEQSAWWHEMERQFTGPVTFHDCSDALAFDNEGVVTETISLAGVKARQAAPQQIPELHEVIAEEIALLEEVELVDLHAPWFASARRR